ncbi:calcium-binding and coiled-coil domain-containing protein 1b isoform X2 [Embiotoca jacksoni]|uniref:calcium-binding and coiled-coil domain-containing protein 1b isoform X2 n=2 Tax=Embiotoca jacksoni TaxID=100190 RepID=UPI003703DB05
MDQQAAVVFRNVGQLYFPQTRVECHYSLTPEQRWSSRDWIGIFEMGWSSVKQYYTYTWALVPEGYTEGTSVDYCALFQASYLPRPGPVEYQFVYVDKDGEVRARSRPFTFYSPKPLEELETLKEEQDEEDGEEEMLLVVPRAQLLQSRLEECLKQRADLQRALDAAKQETEDERENGRKARTEWERERELMTDEVVELRDNLRHSGDMLKMIEGRHQDVKYSEENLTSELSKLLDEKVESQRRIRDLEDDFKLLADREREENNEVERLKERVRKMSCQMKHDEEKRKALQLENEAALAEVLGLQERLEAGDHLSDSLRRELRELGGRQGHTHTELHQARLQVAQLTLQLSEENLLLREERANWALEREAYKHAAEIEKKKLQDLSCEVQRKEEWLQEERTERERVESDLRREKDYSKGLLDYIHQLEQRLAILPQTESDVCTSAGSSSEDDDASSSSICSPLLPAEEDAPAEDTQDEKTQRCETGAAEGKHPILPELVHPVLSNRPDAPMW